MSIFHKSVYTADYAVFTDPGNRPVNEDSIGFSVTPSMTGFFLCDGLGGHGMGDAASQCAIKTFKEVLQNETDALQCLKSGFEEAQQAVLSEQLRLKADQKMKTTAVMLLMDAARLYVGHIGDSRVYLFAKTQVFLQTKDHSVPQQLVEIGEITPDQIRHHPERSMLLKVIGTPWEGAPYELEKPIPLKKAEAFLLCSDGFWELITEEDMLRYMNQSRSASEWLDAMAETVKKNGAGSDMDNYSAIAGFILRDGKIVQ